jgi:methionyl-tRNA formyltransferase
MRIVFMGSDPIALPLLDALASERLGSANLVGVFTQPDRARGRGHRIQENSIKLWARERDLPIYQPERCDVEACQTLTALNPDYVLVMAFGQLLPRKLLNLFPGRFLNLHASLLPRLRGASPIQTALACGLEKTGVSLMQIEPRMDAGPVADSEVVPILPRDRSKDLHGRIAQASVSLMERNEAALRSGKLQFTEQDESVATYARLINKEDAALDFRVSAWELGCRIRAFNPWPGPRFPHKEIEVRVHEAEPINENPSAIPGTILRSGEAGLWIACGQSVLRVLSLQRPGGRVLAAAEFLRGYPLEVGTVLESRSMPELERHPLMP